jgi:peptidoglycan L-alanyl-D-glutamate endopeptidase CwlK
MANFSEKSQTILNTCHPDLIKLFTEVVKHFDCTILCGHRGEKEQNEAFQNKASKLQWPDSKHNKMLSLAVDAVPYPVDWEDEKRIYFFVGFVKGIAAELGVNIRCGADWDSDTQVNDQDFIDLPHFELI